MVNFDDLARDIANLDILNIMVRLDLEFDKGSSE